MRKKRIIHTYESCKQIALKYNRRIDLAKGDIAVYHAIYRNGWNELFDHMVIESKPAGYWDYEKCREAALQCRYKSEFKTKFPSAIIPAQKNGWYDEITSHMVKKPLKRKYSRETAIEAAAQYKTRTEVLNNDAWLYRILGEHNLLDELYPTSQSVNKQLRLEGKKKCNKCKEIKDISEFDLINKNKPDKGYRTKCKECFHKYSKEYYASVRENVLVVGGKIHKKRLWESGKKQCTKCKEVKDIKKDFYNYPDGIKVSPRCVQCVHEQNKKRYPMVEGGKLWKLSLRNEGKKWCNSCKEAKPLDDFGFNKKNRIDGRMTMCRVCKSERDKEYRNDPKFRDKLLDKKRVYYENIRDTEGYKEYCKNRNENRDYSKEYRRHISDEFRRFKTRIRSRINAYFRINKQWVKKDTKTVELLGVDYFVAKEFLERQFLSGMTWENYGTEWHIDHLIPLDAAKKDYEKVKQLCFYQNLTPMWGNDNLRKSSKIPNVCCLWKNPIVPYKEKELIIVPKVKGIVK